MHSLDYSNIFAIVATAVETRSIILISVFEIDTHFSFRNYTNLSPRFFHASRHPHRAAPVAILFVGTSMGTSR